MKSFKAMITKTIHALLDHKDTRKILEDSIYALFENPETRKILEKCLVQAIIKYGAKTAI